MALYVLNKLAPGSYAAASVSGLNLSMTFEVTLFHLYSLLLLALLCASNLRGQLAPAYFYNTAFLLVLETGLGSLQATGALGMPEEREWSDSSALGNTTMFWLRNVAGFGLGFVGLMRLVSRCCCCCLVPASELTARRSSLSSPRRSAAFSEHSEASVRGEIALQRLHGDAHTHGGSRHSPSGFNRSGGMFAEGALV